MSTSSLDIDNALDVAERSLESGGGLNGTGFWPAVNQLRSNSVLAVRYGDRVADIDRRAFERGVRMRVPIGWGVAILASGTLAAAAGLVVASRLANTPKAIVFLAAFAMLLLSTHSQAHYVVG